MHSSTGTGGQISADLVTDLDLMTVPRQRYPQCGAVKRGNACRRPAGWGTEHPGFGHCKLHGGNTPGGKKAALKAAAAAMARADVIEIDVNAVDGVLYPIRRMAALAMHYRRRMAAMDPGADGWVWWADREREALDDLARWSKMALDAGVAERKVQLAERWGQQIAAALDDAIGPVNLQPAVRAGIVERFAASLTLLEQADDEPIEGEEYARI